MSEERDIEKKLRAYAEKRRKDAGGPFELHPATRRMLQGEVARQQGESARKPPPTNFLEKIFFMPLPRLTWVLSALAILAVGTWVFLGTLPKSKEVVSTSETAGFVQGAATLAKDAMPESSARQRVEADAERDVSANRGLALNEPTPAKPAESPALVQPVDKLEAGKSYDLAATKEVRPAGSSVGSDLGDRTVTVAAAPAPAATPAPASVVANTAAVGQQINNYNFRNNYAVAAIGGKADGLAGDDLKKSLDEAKTKRADQNVLMDSFQFEQAGEQVRIVDNDGSVYTGNLLVAETEATAQTDSPARFADAAKPAVEPVAEEQSRRKNQNESNAQNQNFRFAVSGTNRSWNQKVAITGEVLNAGNLVVNSVTNQSGSLPGLPSQQQFNQRNFNNSLLLSNGRIIGRVVAADGREVELNATQVSP